MESRNPKVCIAIPTYNRAHCVERAIKSVLSQEYLPLELIIVDDGSTDDTAQVLARYVDDPRVRVVRHERNLGVTAAKNTALDHMDAEFGGILDSDDELLPGAVSMCVDAFRTFPHVCQVFGDCIDSLTGQRAGTGPDGPSEITYEAALCGSFAGEFWQLFRVSDLGTRRFNPDAAGGEALVWHAMLRDKPAYYLHRPVRRYYTEGLDRVSHEWSFEMPKCRAKMMVYQAYLEEFADDLTRLCPARYGAMALELAKWKGLCGDHRGALRTVMEARASVSVLQWSKGIVLAGLPRPLHVALRTALRRSRRRGGGPQP